jgi:hypothetical protein
MAQAFNDQGIAAAAFVSDVDPTQCETLLDFVGQVHRKYRMDTRLKALLPRHRHSIDREVENNFPHLPAGCAIQFDKLSRKYVQDNIRANLQKLATQVPERLQTFTSESGQELTFGNFIRYHDYEPERLLVADSWTGWKARAHLAPVPSDPDLPFPCPLELHARFSATDILAAFGRATLDTAGQRGTGVLHFRDIKAYSLLITFQKTEKEFSPTTMYADYPISRSLLHWESQSITALDSPTGQNLVHHADRGYTILVFARDRKSFVAT